MGLVELWVGPLDGEAVRCTLEALDEDVARVRLPDGAELEATAEGTFRLTEGPDGASVILPVVVGWPEQVDGHVVCELFFIEGSLLPDDVRGRNRRRSARISPAAGEVELTLQSDRPGAEQVIPATLVDLSSGGLAMELPAGQEPTRPFTVATLQVLLPGEEYPLVLTATVRHRSRQSKELVRYGLEFDPARTPAYEEQTSHIATWVTRRRGEVAAMALPPGQ